MAIARVQTKLTSAGVSQTSHAATLDGTPSDNNALIASGLFSGDPGTITPPTGWTQAYILADSGGGQRVFSYYKIASGEGTSWTWTTANSVVSAIRLYEYSGLTATQASLLDATQTNDPASTGTTCSTGTTASTVVADELLLATVAINGAPGGAAWTWSNSFVDDGANIRLGTSALIVAAISTYETTGTWTTARERVGGIATFKVHTVGTNALSAPVTLYEPTVTPGSVTVATNALSAPVTLYNPGVAYSISTNALSSPATIYEPTITVGSVTISTNALDASVTLYNPTVAIINYIVMNALDASATVYNQVIRLHTYPFGAPDIDLSHDSPSTVQSDVQSAVFADVSSSTYSDPGSSYYTDG